jgi:serine/threonine-protein kinase
MTAQSEATHDQAAPGADQPSAHLPAGYVVGDKYVIKRVLGEGANGSVYEGEHTQIGHRVAIKVVHKALAASADTVARFTREARICGTIRNRNVGQVYDVGELPDGAPYMVMELHEGRSLAKMLAETGPLPFAVALDIAQQLLVGLQAAHEGSVVHRDVKPDNIMIVRESSGHMLVKLVDFGIGKSLAADMSSRSVTQEGAVIGSPDYMSPEALRGEEVDLRADIYAAGVVLYEMVTGSVPFDASSMTELFVAILRDPVTPVRKRRPECPVQLERAIQKAMHRVSAERYRSASEMREALERVRRACGYSSDVLTRFSLQPAGGAAPANAQGFEARAPERVMTAELQLPVKRTGKRLIVGFAMVAILGGAALLLWPGAREPAPSKPKTPPPSAATPATTATPVAPAIPEAQPQPEQAAVAPASEPSAAEPEPAEHAEPAAVGGKARDKRGRKAEVAAASTHARGKSRAPAEAPAAAANPTELLQQAAAAFVRGQMPRARALYREATERAPSSAEAWRGLGMVSSRMGERSEAARALKRYLTLRPNAPDAAAIQKKLQEL